MQIGVFLPTSNNGWYMSRHSPQFMPSFEMNRHVVQTAERYGFDFALAMSKLHGFGGETEYWDHSFESVALVGGLAAVTQRIKLFATIPMLAFPPAIAARMATTLSDVGAGRVGLNMVAGWQRAEYEQMALWPGDHYFAERYDYAGEYVQILRELFETGESSFTGKYFDYRDCKLGPLPKAPMDFVCAGQSAAGVAFSARYGDYNFCSANGTNAPRSHEKTVTMMREAAAATGRNVGSFVLTLLIADETDEAAFARWDHYRAGADEGAIAWMTREAGANTKSDPNSVVAKLNLPEGAVAMNVGRLIGSYANVARMLDEMAEVEGTSGVMLGFEDHWKDLEIFGTRIQPLMRSRAHLRLAA